MNIILLSGGSGKRLWPLSTADHAKQFLKIYELPNGSSESMLQRMYRMISEVDSTANIIIAAPREQHQLIHTQLGEKVLISDEPCRRDTFPAIALASAYLYDKMKLSNDDIVLVCPIDSFVDRDFFDYLIQLYTAAQNGKVHLSLMGIHPSSPSEKYGYIIPNDEERISLVQTFIEKPDALSAQQYVDQGALWNSGVFAFRLQYMMDISLKILGTFNYYELLDNYNTLPEISFDYAVVEKEPNIQVLRFSGVWKDIGTWDSFTEVLPKNIYGNASAFQSENTHILNNTQIPLVAIGATDLAIIATENGILVINKNQSDLVKKYISERDETNDTV